jgi:hypothetical protein
MGVLGNIYCIPHAPGSVSWSMILSPLVERGLVRPPFRSGSPFKLPTDRSQLLWPENWIAPNTIRASASPRPRDFPELQDALGYLQGVADAMITMDSPCAAFQFYPDERDLSAALAVYRFGEPVVLSVGVPNDFSDLVDEFPELGNQPTEPKWQGAVSELLWLHGKCVPDESEFFGSPLHEALKATWPSHLLLSDVFL